jgi:hypothetical protein
MSDFIDGEGGVGVEVLPAAVSLAGGDEVPEDVAAMFDLSKKKKKKKKPVRGMHAGLRTADIEMRSYAAHGLVSSILLGAGL